eukprot:COSAG01_NODE_176_length_22957_cov_72.262096_2_plen_553_part_00
MRTRESAEAVAAFTAAALTPVATRSAEADADVLQIEKSLDSIQEDIDSFDAWLEEVVAQHGSSKLLSCTLSCLRSISVKGYYKGTTSCRENSSRRFHSSIREIDFLRLSAGDVIANISSVTNDNCEHALFYGYRLAQPDVLGFFSSNYVEETEAPCQPLATHTEGEPEPEPSAEVPTTQAARIGDGEPISTRMAEQSQTTEERGEGGFPEQMDLFLRCLRGDVYDHMDNRRVQLIEVLDSCERITKEFAKCGQERLLEMMHTLEARMTQEFEERLKEKAKQFNARIGEAEKTLDVMETSLMRENSGSLGRTASNSGFWTSLNSKAPGRDHTRSHEITLLQAVCFPVSLSLWGVALSLGPVGLVGMTAMNFGLKIYNAPKQLRLAKQNLIISTQTELNKQVDHLCACVKDSILTANTLRLFDRNLKQCAIDVHCDMKVRLAQNREALIDLTEIRANTQQDVQKLEELHAQLQCLGRRIVGLHDEYLIRKGRDDELVIDTGADLSQLDVKGLRARARDVGLAEEDIDAACKKSEAINGEDNPRETREYLKESIT